jgi:hypothetical protein
MYVLAQGYFIQLSAKLQHRFAETLHYKPLAFKLTTPLRKSAFRTLQISVWQCFIQASSGVGVLELVSRE